MFQFLRDETRGAEASFVFFPFLLNQKIKKIIKINELGILLLRTGSKSEVVVLI